jgi:hypothetical protein
MGPGLTIAQALESELDGPLLVRGWLIAVGDEVRLCAEIAESNPPECAGASLRIEDVDVGALGDLEQANDVSWSREVMKLLGRVDGDALLVDETSNG